MCSWTCSQSFASRSTSIREAVARTLKKAIRRQAHKFVEQYVATSTAATATTTKASCLEQERRQRPTSAAAAAAIAPATFAAVVARIVRTFTAIAIA